MFLLLTLWFKKKSVNGSNKKKLRRCWHQGWTCYWSCIPAKNGEVCLFYAANFCTELFHVREIHNDLIILKQNSKSNSKLIEEDGSTLPISKRKRQFVTNTNRNPFIPTSICNRDVAHNVLAPKRHGTGCCKSLYLKQNHTHKKTSPTEATSRQ